MTACTFACRKTRNTEIKPDNRTQSPQWRDGKFHNGTAIHRAGFWETLAISWRFMFDKPANTIPDQPIPVQPLSRDTLLAAPDNSHDFMKKSRAKFRLFKILWHNKMEI